MKSKGNGKLENNAIYVTKINDIYIYIYTQRIYKVIQKNKY